MRITQFLRLPARQRCQPGFRFQRDRRLAERPLCAKSGPSLTIIIYVRNIFGLAAKEASHPSMMATSRATTSAVPPTADIVGQRGHVGKVPNPDIGTLQRVRPMGDVGQPSLPN